MTACIFLPLNEENIFTGPSGSKGIFLKPDGCIKKIILCGVKQSSHYRALQCSSSNSWSFVEQPLEGDLILPMIACVFGIPQYWPGILPPNKFWCLRQIKDVFDRESNWLESLVLRFLVFYTGIIPRHHLVSIGMKENMHRIHQASSSVPLKAGDNPTQVDLSGYIFGSFQRLNVKHLVKSSTLTSFSAQPLPSRFAHKKPRKHFSDTLHWLFRVLCTEKSVHSAGHPKASAPRAQQQ